MQKRKKFVHVPHHMGFYYYHQICKLNDDDEETKKKSTPLLQTFRKWMIIIITIINDLKHYRKKNKWKSYRKQRKWISISWKIMVMMIMMIIAVASQSPSSSNQLSHKTKPSSWSQNVHWSIVRYHADIFVFNLWSANEVCFIVCVCVFMLIKSFKTSNQTKTKQMLMVSVKGSFLFL